MASFDVYCWKSHIHNHRKQGNISPGYFTPGKASDIYAIDGFSDQYFESVSVGANSNFYAWWTSFHSKLIRSKKQFLLRGK